MVAQPPRNYMVYGRYIELVLGKRPVLQPQHFSFMKYG